MPRRPIIASLRRARHDIYRRAIIDAAESVFAQHGFEQTRMQEVAAAADVSVGVLYDVFPGKEALLAAVHEARGRDLFEHVTAPVPDPSPRGFLLTGMERMVRFFDERPAYLRMLLREGNTWSHPEFAKGLDLRTWKLAAEQIEAAFAAGRADGSFVDDDPRASARLLMAIAQACLNDWILAKPRPPKETVVARVQELVRRNFFKR